MHDAGYAWAPRSFEDVERTFNIRADVVSLGDIGIRNSNQSGQMKDNILVAYCLNDELRIFDISGDHLDRILQIKRQMLKISPCRRRRVPDHGRHVSARARESFREMTSYESAGAGNKDFSPMIELLEIHDRAAVELELRPYVDR
ncbi:hypothetical protein GCM10007857_85730 [Bradyrhizobium iriomotense]|uniref:Uncharacterized protein n=1 Tax=Bradyrhizobium iriomotense TaxID=441950 RepID=A0ABQ6BFZ3_9BRAD|nr:hypothetical protein GCM10007857_85730 [Bradyrhizobium iriomotense]